MNYPPRRFPITELLPQRGVMRLVDEVVEITDETARTALTVRDDPLFLLEPGRVPAWVGLEYMAQTVAVWSGYHCLHRGEPIRAGLLLGTRRFEAAVDHFPVGQKLCVRARRVFRAANDMCVFDCAIEAGRPLADARLNVLLPQDLKAYLERADEV
ncbi:hypothetical protein MIT9_P0405 [Methylomarinovum caldicuralii]|uniref:3-hydroxylacyl-ACP dehydratase n=1 Tax=Methylomarinovum caldicuralii TaxID=438856 RepID=A0AAU9C174_9GAMM|nr:hotdog family protein [Methylomarinovum caldicuralii]BCX80829.1 hypothetical protein MIT9_P0405 [Methylomarinovum caldicuralii]